MLNGHLPPQEKRIGYACEVAPLGSPVANDLMTLGYEPISVFVAVVQASSIAPPAPQVMVALRARVEVSVDEFNLASMNIEKAQAARSEHAKKSVVTG